MPAASVVHEFGSFRLDSAERLLLRAGQQIGLTPKAFDLLVYLVDRAGRLVTKQELMTALWPASFVEEANLTFTVSALRKALGDGHDGEQFIQTVPTRGYRFVAPVTPVATHPAPSSLDTQSRALKPVVRRIAIVALVVAVLAMLPVVVSHLREEPHAPMPASLTIPLPESPGASASAARISPDGRRVALIAAAWGSRIWLRNIDGLAPPLPIAGTEGAGALVWAPDGQQLAFTTAEALKKLNVSDGTIQTLCDSCQPTGGVTWSRTGTILFTTQDGSLLSIPAAGASPRAVTRLDRSRGEVSHLYPHFLPDGVRFLYLRRSADASRSGLYVGQVGSMEPQLVLEGDVPAIYASPGYLLFLRGGTLMAQRFDPKRLTLSGEASPLVPTPERSAIAGQPAFSASDTGVLTYPIVERPLTQFQWVDREGALLQLVGEVGPYYTFDLSADGKRLVFAQADRGSTTLRVRDLEREVTQHLTFATSIHADPRWSADGQTLFATRWRPLPQTVVQISPDRHESIISAPGEGNMVEDVSPDGRYLLYRQRGRQLRVMSLGEESESVLVRKAPSGGMNQAQFSPDSRWIAYHSNETGRLEVYVTPFPPTGESWPVSAGGGAQPVWRQDGRELYYLGLDGTLNGVEVRPGKRPQFSRRIKLFPTGIRPAENVEQYAASGDGKRFLLLKVVEENNRSSVGVVLNWPALLEVTRSR